ncbi:MAG TPA: hypothetical protein VGK20_18145 [Candidatus Binatia bacterium]|jgi:hypothetical protein
MKALRYLAFVAIAFVVANFAPGPAHAVTATAIMTFQTMYGVDGPFVGPNHPVRGIPGDEAPWAIGDGTNGELDSDGHLVVHVRGLVFANVPSVPPNLRGINDAADFRAVVSCLTEKSETAVGHKHVTTQGFPATSTGNADIDTMVTLPDQCIAPVIFILPGDERKWFAVTGFGS